MDLDGLAAKPPTPPCPLHGFGKRQPTSLLPRRVTLDRGGISPAKIATGAHRGNVAQKGVRE